MFLLFLVLAGQTGGDVYRVSDRASFISAVGCDRTIVVEEGAKIVLSPGEDLSSVEPGSILYPETDFVTWAANTDGSSLVIRNVRNLEIRGEGQRESSLLAEPRYVFVLEFRNCSGIRLSNLKLGHTVGGYCDSGVLGVKDCTVFSVADCLLFGCGTEGLTVFDSESLNVTGSEIANCTYGIMTCRDSDDLLFRDCVFRDNEEFYGIDLSGCEGVAFSGCLFSNDLCHFTPAFITSYSGGPVIIENSIFDSITCPLLFSGEDFILNGNRFTDVMETEGPLSHK